jgi:putative transposase
VLSCLDFAEPHRRKLHSTTRWDGSVRKSSVAPKSSASFPTRPRFVQLMGAVLLEQNDEWQLQHCYMQVEVMAELAAAAGDPRQIPYTA